MQKPQLGLQIYVSRQFPPPLIATILLVREDSPPAHPEAHSPAYAEQTHRSLHRSTTPHSAPSKHLSTSLRPSTPHLERQPFPAKSSAIQADRAFSSQNCSRHRRERKSAPAPAPAQYPAKD